MYTFTRWVSTPENRSALAAVQRLADALCTQRLRGQPNPLFLHGPAGTGKTHLVSALIGSVSQCRPTLTCTHLPAADAAALLLPVHEDEDRGASAATVDWHSDLLVVEDLQHL